MTSKMQDKPSPHRLQNKPWATLRAATVGLAMAAAGAAWAAPTVIFVATDLADTTVGEDLWRYAYSISGPVDAFGSVNLLFSPASYANLVSQTTDANLGLLETQPDTGLPADGIVYVTPFSDLLASDTALLSVDFVWLGGSGSTPGAQKFDVVDGAGGFAGSGVTRLQSGGGTVPEPSALLLTATALLALLALSARRKRSAPA